MDRRKSDRQKTEDLVWIFHKLVKRERQVRTYDGLIGQTKKVSFVSGKGGTVLRPILTERRP